MYIDSFQRTPSIYFSFPDTDFESIYVLESDPSDKLLHQIAVPMLTEKESRHDDTYLWSDAPSDELYNRMLVNSQKKKENTKETAMKHLQLYFNPPKCRQTW